MCGDDDSGTLLSAVSGDGYLYPEAWEVYETEAAEQAAAVIHKAWLKEGVHRDQLVLHSDHGAPMKGGDHGGHA